MRFGRATLYLHQNSLAAHAICGVNAFALAPSPRGTLTVRGVSGPTGSATTAMARQLEADPNLSARLDSPWDLAVVLERIARGGGATRWYLARTQEDSRRILRLLPSGSRVAFYFGAPLRVGQLSETVIGAMFEAVGEVSELVIGWPVVEEPVRLAVESVFRTERVGPVSDAASNPPEIWSGGHSLGTRSPTQSPWCWSTLTGSCAPTVTESPQARLSATRHVRTFVTGLSGFRHA
jgi:hypothetical protein